MPPAIPPPPDAHGWRAETLGTYRAWHLCIALIALLGDNSTVDGQGLRQIEWRYGPSPSTEDHDIVLPPYINPLTPWLDASTSTERRIHRRPLSIRKADDQYATGVRPDGTPIPRLAPMADPIAFFERFPHALWPWLPVLVIFTALSLVVATVAIALALT